jgi:hypothetical protein
MCVIALVTEWSDTHGYMYVCDPVMRGLYESRTTENKSEAKHFATTDKALAYMKEHMRNSPFYAFTMEVKSD